MPYLKIFIHCVWATKSRLPLIKDEIRPLVIKHLYENAEKKNIKALAIGGYRDHMHFLYSSDAVQSIANVINTIKGESSFWINKQKFIPEKFEWQDEYFAVSVSPSVLPKVISYIRNQEKHHGRKTFAQEYIKFLSDAGFEIDLDSKRTE